MNIEEEIRLGKIYKNFPNQGTIVKFLDYLTVDQFYRFESSIFEIEELHNIRRLMGFVEMNEDEITNYLNSTLHDFISRSASWNDVGRQDGNQGFLNTNRLLLNYLSSLRTFLDHSGTFLNRKYGPGSSQFLEFKKMLSLFYDNSFAYRFFYKLRNYSQHIGLPLDSFQFSAEYDDENEKMKGTLKVAFNRDKLLSSYDSWGTVRQDLVKNTAEFDMMPLIFEMTHNIKEIKRNIEILHKGELSKAANFITQLTNHLQTDDGEIFVAHNFQTKENGELLSFQSIYIPFDTIYFIQTKLMD